ncbi:MAG: hypothetical protein RLY90_513, partial [Pseudomonadota bacterium]
MRLAGIWAGSALGVALILAGCANHGRLAPVEERTLGGSHASTQPVPGAENAGQPGYYT